MCKHKHIFQKIKKGVVGYGFHIIHHKCRVENHIIKHRTHKKLDFFFWSYIDFPLRHKNIEHDNVTFKWENEYVFFSFSDDGML